MKLLACAAAGRTELDRVRVGLEQAAGDWPRCGHDIRSLMKVRICGQAWRKILASRARTMLGPSPDAWISVVSARRIAAGCRRFAGTGHGRHRLLSARGGSVRGEHD